MTELNTKTRSGWNMDNSYAGLPEIFFTRQQPTPVISPRLVVLNEELGENLGLDPKELKGSDSIVEFAGNRIPEGGIPIAQAYGGHQFGYFTMLGDGRAILIGEQITPKGERYDIQLKGPGRTPYSRGGDGRAALGPMLREYIISEAMHALGIPTTRGLAVVTTGEAVVRENLLPGAVLTRVASSHIRVGTFQYAYKWGTIEELRALADYTMHRHYSEVSDDVNPYLSMLRGVIMRQASLIAKWQLVGFIHGVMNTDNMTISGETIDYGPCAFMDTYDPKTVFSSIDTHGRYAYGSQPGIAAWNLARFAETLLPLLHKNDDQALKLAEEAVSDFSRLHHDEWLSGMRAKLGLFNEEQEDEKLIEELLNMMEEYGADYTNTFRSLTKDHMEDTPMFDAAEFANWHERWKERLKRQQESENSSRMLMQSSNPSVIPRNHRVEEALEAAVKQGDYSVMERLVKVLQAPYDYSKEHSEYCAPAPLSATPYRTFCGT